MTSWKVTSLYIMRGENLACWWMDFGPSAFPAPAALPPLAPRPRPPAVAYRSPAEVTEAELLDALRACRWEVKPAAVRLGIWRPSLYLFIERCPGVRKTDRTRPARVWP